MTLDPLDRVLWVAEPEVHPYPLPAAVRTRAERLTAPGPLVEWVLAVSIEHTGPWLVLELGAGVGQRLDDWLDGWESSDPVYLRWGLAPAGYTEQLPEFQGW